MSEEPNLSVPFLELIQQLLVELKTLPPDDPHRPLLENVLARLRTAAEESLQREQMLIAQQSDSITHWLSWLVEQIRSGDTGAQVLGQTIIDNLSDAQRSYNELMDGADGQTSKVHR